MLCSRYRSARWAQILWSNFSRLSQQQFQWSACAEIERRLKYITLPAARTTISSSPAADVEAIECISPMHIVAPRPAFTRAETVRRSGARTVQYRLHIPHTSKRHSTFDSTLTAALSTNSDRPQSTQTQTQTHYYSNYIAHRIRLQFRVRVYVTSRISECVGIINCIRYVNAAVSEIFNR